MARYLLASTPVHGHVAPMANIAATLVRAGHRVRFLTGALFHDAIAATGGQHVALPASADYDARDMDAAFPGRTTRSGLRKLTFDVQHTFVKPVRAQADALRALLDAEPVDAVLAETGFLGVLPLLVDPRPRRPPVVSVGITVLTLSSRDTAPFGLGLPPSSSAAGRVRNRLLNLLVRRAVFGPNQRRLNRTLRAMDLPHSPAFFLDWPRLADRILQLSVRGFEYPRSDLPSQVRFVGPPPAHDAIRNQKPPPWWHELLAARGTGRPVVHVTQGTVDTSDLNRVIGPALHALADKDVFVVVTTGGPDPAQLSGVLPANARAATYVPYADLLPHVDLAITNGGFGGTQLMLAHGIPLVVAGDTEDKLEVAGRVAASGAGINLRTGTPTTPALASAVETILRNPTYRQRARALAAEYASRDTEALIQAELSDVTRQRSMLPRP
ncbi:glycosyltransferase [Phytohabitans houttuyneae]|uniref:Glycosyl transferase n=1 Tax=Phytohabitans houttuyneae TaxID=1076126 RepID=A0A6V8KVL6_9ACTN|nr:nucleotide disphospho-sugar-binding domain-containing protein [Phytohabitans houttuyneae]GFJ86339.1 glycosyl transferase [Phytohabitans houttuyneae]